MYDYITRTMPWQDPGSLNEDVAWAVTAHVISLNGYDSIPELNAENAVSFRLQPEVTSTSELPAATNTIVKPTETSATLSVNADNGEQQSGNRSTFLWISGTALAILVIVFIIRRSRT